MQAAFTTNLGKSTTLTTELRAVTADTDSTTRPQDFAPAIGAAVLAIVVAAAGIRSGRRVANDLIEPVESLTRQAKVAANEEMPRLVAAVHDLRIGDQLPSATPFPEPASKEFAGLASALNVMQSTALELAVEQATLRRNTNESLVNLGRRNQGLLSRTIAFITELEQNEHDPETLSDLFRLDHLTTRMRRNAESLLVLAGSEPPRTWSDPIPVDDVLRAALSEIESYDRVDLGQIQPTRIKGTAVSDIAHLLSELMENATNFSPPSSRVLVAGTPSETATRSR